MTDHQPVSFEQYLEEEGTLVYTNVGTSMLPLLRQNKDLFIIEKKGAGRCRKGDVVLYRRRKAGVVSGSDKSHGRDDYILHRIVEVRPDGYVLLGDNCVRREYGIREEDVIGVMTGFVRDGRQHRVDEPAYRLYSLFFLYGVPLRIVMKKVARRIRGMIKPG